MHGLLSLLLLLFLRSEGFANAFYTTACLGSSHLCLAHRLLANRLSGPLQALAPDVLHNSKALPEVPEAASRRIVLGLIFLGGASGTLSLASSDAAWFESSPPKPLKVHLAIVVTSRERAAILQADLKKGRMIDECRGVVKTIVKDLKLKEGIKEGVTFLNPERKREAVKEIGFDGLEYLSSVVEFDGYDEFKKDYTSQVALNTMSEEKLDFIVQALGSGVQKLDAFLTFFSKEDVEEARDIYNRYYKPVEQQEELQRQD